MRPALIAAALLVCLAAGCGKGYSSTRGATLTHFTLESSLVHRDLHELLVRPKRHGDWLLVLLHGRGSHPSQFLSQPFFDELAALGEHAPTVLLLDGGDHSYWHDRADGAWGSMVVREAIPAGVARAHAARVAIGGISMGGYGALLLGSRRPFCAVGAHSPALWARASDTAPGAFDDATDFGRNTSVGRYASPVWIDVGADDPFHDTAVATARRLHAQLHVWPGGHTGSYWRAHMRSYLRFYASACG